VSSRLQKCVQNAVSYVKMPTPTHHCETVSRIRLSRNVAGGSWNKRSRLYLFNNAVSCTGYIALNEVKRDSSVFFKSDLSNQVSHGVRMSCQLNDITDRYDRQEVHTHPGCILTTPTKHTYSQFSILTLHAITISYMFRLFLSYHQTENR